MPAADSEPQPEVWQLPSDSRKAISTVRLAELARRQWGVVSARQLLASGYGPSGIGRLVRRGALRPVDHGVYAFGIGPLPIEARLVVALIVGGSGAALSHTTAAWWWGILDREPRVIHVAARRRPAPRRDVRFHRPRILQATTRRRLRVTPVARTLRDLAAVVDARTLRRAIAEADHLDLLKPSRVIAQLGRGRPGSAALRAALEAHLPQLARSASELETEFLLLIHAAGIAPPEVNGWVSGLKVDAAWRDARLVVELDGHATHAKPAAIERDRRRELILRRAGFRVCRYTWSQVRDTPEAVCRDLRTELRRRA